MSDTEPSLPSLITSLAQQLANLTRQSHFQQMQLAERQLFLSGRQACLALEGRSAIDSLCDVEFRVYSQTGEDGIIEWLVRNLPIRSERFVEFGVENYQEANTRFLLRNRNWKGLVIDGSPSNIESVQADTLHWMHDLTARAAFITRENINDLIGNAGFRGDIGLLSVDIDGNDYWVLDAIEVVRADILVCEYNSVLGDRHPIAVPYDPTFQRHKAHYSHVYYGTSIAALKLLAERKGYTLIGSDSAGHNAFFVRDDLAGSLAVANRRALPALIRESRDPEGRLSFAGPRQRYDLIKDLPVVDVETGCTKPLKDFDNLYSEAWLKHMSKE
ncbi:hypothetical protein ACHMW5_08040 (plasmid) [Azospirillum melinis]|uniref:hypothetical protein n=1 Tax=Azospirillum melinis TaxID=328839 RepID=UPI003757B0AE